MHYKSLLHKKWLKLLIGFICGIMFKFPVDVVLAVLYSQYNLLNNAAEYLILVLASLLLFHLFANLNPLFERHYSWDSQPKKRFAVQLIVHFLLAIFIVFPAKYLFNYLIFKTNFYIINFEILSLVILLLVILIFNLTELGFFLLNKWRYSLALLEKFKKENAEFKFETLVNQINPHFLFNSLNTLSSLVYENQDVAAKYIRELAKVYRYVLDNKENELVTLQSDLEFLRSYVYLFELRFANMISFAFNIDSSKQDCLIAPMTTQLLVENAVKHNIISSKKHLKISIFSENEYLIVANNLQKKNDKPYSSGMGLNNIRSRYKYLSDNEIIIQETKETFIVKIPLIDRNGQAESK